MLRVEQMDPYVLPSRSGLKSGCEKELVSLIREVERALQRRKEECDQKVALAQETVDSYSRQLNQMQEKLRLGEEKADAVRERSRLMEETYRQHVGQLKAEIERLKEQYELASKEFHEKINKKATKEASAIADLRRERSELQKEVETLILQIERRKDSRRALQKMDNDLKEKERRLGEMEAERKEDFERLARQVSHTFLQEESRHMDDLKITIMQKIRDVKKQFES